MTTREELLGLAGRCEAATGADQELDAAIMGLLYVQTRRYIGAHHDDGRRVLDRVWVDTSTDKWISTHPRQFTASLDAAMTLVPTYHKWFVGRDWAGVWHEDFHTCPLATEVATRGRHPALALVEACLRARAAQIGGGS